MSLRESHLGKYYYAFLKKYILSKIHKSYNVSPEKITLVGVGIAFFVPICFHISSFLGVFLIILSSIFDSLDGMLARERGTVSAYGAFLDSTVDRLSDFFYLLGFWVLSLKYGHIFLFTLLFFLALTFTLLFSYTKARIEGLGGECKVGFMERAKRVIFLIIFGMIMCFFKGWIVFLAGMIIYNILMIYSVIQRINCAKKVL